jgi:heat shock protein HtpX
MGEVPETPTPILVYNRIDANRRRTRLLLASFVLAFWPVVLAPAVVIMPLLVAFLFFASMAPLHGGEPGVSATFVLIMVALAVVSVLAIPLTTAFLIWRYGSRMLLRLARARSLSPGEEPDLVRLVQSLCIGAGLPLPRIHLVESMAPNAFATGSNPRTASLIVTRGLLRLLDRRELEGVIAHELSHIGNHDIRLTTTLAALVGVATLPLRSKKWAALVFLVGVNSWFPLLRAILWFVLGIHEVPAVLWWLGVTGPPVYVLFVSPVVALLIRQAVSRQREFLADADAVLLTRDPEALALALVKIGAAGGNRLRVGEGSVHLYFVDPLEPGISLLHRIFPSHPPLQERIELLARMGSGIAASALKAAREAGDRIHEAGPGLIDLDAPQADTKAARPRLEPDNEPAGLVDDALPTVYEQPDGRSRRDDGFTRLYDRPADGSHVLLPPPEADHALTPLYEQPDGWSRVLAQLPESAVVIPVAIEGHFIRVTTAEHQAGYVSRSAPLAALKKFQQ